MLSGLDRHKFGQKNGKGGIRRRARRKNVQNKEKDEDTALVWNLQDPMPPTWGGEKHAVFSTHFIKFNHPINLRAEMNSAKQAFRQKMFLWLTLFAYGLSQNISKYDNGLTKVWLRNRTQLVGICLCFVSLHLCNGFLMFLVNRYPQLVALVAWRMRDKIQRPSSTH